MAGAPEEGAAGHEEWGGARDSTMATPQKQLASPSSGTLRLRGEVAVGAMCAAHKGGHVWRSVPPLFIIICIFVCGAGKSAASFIIYI